MQYNHHTVDLNPVQVEKKAVENLFYVVGVHCRLADMSRSTSLVSAGLI